MFILRIGFINYILRINTDLENHTKVILVPEAQINLEASA